MRFVALRNCLVEGEVLVFEEASKSGQCVGRFLREADGEPFTFQMNRRESDVTFTSEDLRELALLMDTHKESCPKCRGSLDVQRLLPDVLGNQWEFICRRCQRRWFTK